MVHLHYAMPYFKMVLHIEQRFNTDHGNSVVLLLGQMQLFQDRLLGLHTAQFMVTLAGI